MRKLFTISLLCLLSATAHAQYNGIKPMLGKQIDKSHQLGDFVGAWVLLEGSGNTVVDLSGNGNNGTFVGSPIWVPGNTGPAINFAVASGGNIDCGGSNLLGGGQTKYTWVWSMRPTNIVDNDGIMSKWMSVGGQRIWLIRYFGAGGDIDFFLSEDGATPTALHAGAGYISSGFHQYAISWDADRAVDTEFYKDGVLFSTANGTDAFMHTNANISMKIGRGTTDADFELDGDIEYVYLYSRTLTVPETQQLSINPFIMFKDDLPIEFMFNYGVAAVPGQVIMIQMGKVSLVIIFSAVSALWLNRKAA